MLIQFYSGCDKEDFAYNSGEDIERRPRVGRRSILFSGILR